MILSNSIPFESTNQFSKIFLDYTKQKHELSSFYNLHPSLDNFKAQMETQKFDSENRLVLKDILKKQYKGFKISESVKNNLELIGESNTYTVTTGHQLSLFTGPLYFVFKIVSTIKLAQLLKSTYPTNHFLPVYWMATEDHDFLEINHFYLFGKKYEWNSDQKGPVGWFDTGAVQSIIELLPESKILFEKAYNEHKNLADATRFLVNELFSAFGLLIVDGNDKRLKAEFKSFIINELSSDNVFRCIQESSQALEKAGYSTQVNPREINLFYIEKGLRERIVLEEGRYKVINTNLSFSKEEIMSLVDSNPEKFSPNVVLRPLYQEVVLPNLAYVGGPGELAYWLQLKKMFDQSKVNFPILVPRNFGMIVNKNQLQKLEKLGMQIEDLFLDENSLKKHFLLKRQSTNWDEMEFKAELNNWFDKVKVESMKLDKSLEGFVESQRNEGFKIVDSIAKKFRKTAELKEQEGINQLLNLKSKLFPNGDLQERTENILNFIGKEPLFIEELVRLFDPLRFEFNILELE